MKTLSGKYIKRSNLMLFICAFIAICTLYGAEKVNGMESYSSDMRETPLISSALLVQEASYFKKSLLNIKIRHNAEDKQISFEDKNLPLYNNEVCHSASCKIFSVGDGRQEYKKPSSQFLDKKFSDNRFYGDWIFAKNICISGVGKGTENCSFDQLDDEEFIVILPWIKKEICVAIDKEHNLLDAQGNIPQINSHFSKAEPLKFQGRFEDAIRIASFRDDVDIFSGKTLGCFEGAKGSFFPVETYHFFFVLLPR